MVLWVVVLLLVLVLAAAATRVTLVPSGHVGVVTRRGTYVRMVTAGFLWLPPAERVVTVPATDQQVSSSPSVPTADGRTVAVDLRVVFRVEDPVRFLGAVADASYAVEREAAAALRELSARTASGDLAASNVRAAADVRAALEPVLRRWGAVVRRVEVVVRGDG